MPEWPLLIGREDQKKNALEIAALNVKKREYQKLYMEYWNSTAELTGTGRPVDGLICAVAPSAAVTPGGFNDVGFTSFVNVLDYTSVVIPVTYADKTVDVAPSNNEFFGEVDRRTQAGCESPCSQGTGITANGLADDAEIYDGAPVAVQLVGRRFQEEKMLVLAEHIGAEIRNG